MRAHRAIMPVRPSTTRFHPPAAGGVRATPNDANSPAPAALVTALVDGCVAFAGWATCAAETIVPNNRIASVIIRICTTLNAWLTRRNAAGAVVAHPTASDALTLAPSARTILRLAATN